MHTTLTRIGTATAALALAATLTACGTDTTPQALHTPAQVTATTATKDTKAAPAPAETATTDQAPENATAENAATALVDLIMSDCTRLTGTAKPGDAVADLLNADTYQDINTVGADGSQVLWTVTKGTKVAKVCVDQVRTEIVTADVTGAKATVTVNGYGTLHEANGTAWIVAQAFNLDMIPADTATGWIVTGVATSVASMTAGK